MLKMPIKASRINSLTDARYFAAREVNWLGFDLNAGSDTFVDPSVVKAISEWVTGPLVTGEFDWYEANDIAEACSMLDLKAVQIGPGVDFKTLAKKISIPIIREYIVESIDQIKALPSFIADSSDHVQTTLVNFSANGISWAAIQHADIIQTISDIIPNQELILSISDISKSDVLQIQRMLNGVGIQLSGSEEEKVGLKSFDDIDELLDLLTLEE